MKDVLDFSSPSQAGLWIAKHFTVPTIPKGKHLKEPTRRIVRVGFEGDIGLLVQSGIWGMLSDPSTRVVAVLRHFAHQNEGQPTYRVTMSFRAISRHSGIKSHSAIAKAIRELTEIGWLTRENKRSASPIRPVNTYVLTPDSDALRERANSLARQRKDEIEAERELRRQERMERLKLLSTPNEKG